MSQLIQEAMAFAIARHGDQRRKYTNEPYWKHLAEVAGILQCAQQVTAEMTAAAWLHDTVEDTDTLISEIHNLFGGEVAGLVLGLTDVSRPEDGNRALRKQMDREHLANGCGRVQTIKLADLISNTSSIVLHGGGFARIYLQEKRALLEVLTKGDAHLMAIARSVLHASERQLDAP
jgi:(p)ppGpp synthase/HD superfamily hydrolase